jgi:hypothetical protein
MIPEVLFIPMAQAQSSNELYLMVMPTISLSNGQTDQLITLIGDKNLATEFFADEVSSIELMFKNRTQYFSGGHVTGYSLSHEPTESGRIVVKVLQHVA